MGLRATASVSYRIDGLFVPERRSFEYPFLQGERPGWLSTYGAALLNQIGLTGFAAGVAARAMAELVARAPRTSRSGAPGSQAEDEVILHGVGVHSGRLAAARSHFLTLLAEQDRCLADNGVLNADLALASSHATQTLIEAARDATVFAWDSVSSNVVLGPDPIQRRLRDIFAGLKHVTFTQAALTRAGRAMLGIGTPAPRFGWEAGRPREPGPPIPRELRELNVPPQCLCCSKMALERTLTQPPPLDDLTMDRSVALFLDFDGTLVEIAPRPDAIRVPAGLGRSLERLAEEFSGRLAVVSGRSVADLRGHLGAPHLACAGSHGIERIASDGRPIGAPPRPVPRAVREELRSFARSREGLLFEDKRFGAALHFRARPELGEEAVAHAREIARQADLMLKHGGCVVEVTWPGADKASAVRAFMGHPPFRGAMAVFVGDDLTDEDGFRAAAEFGGFGILVGDRERTGASYRFDVPTRVREWLAL